MQAPERQGIGSDASLHPLPLFFVSADSKGLNVSRKLFRMNTCGDSLQVFILKGLRGQKNR
jgi:hypothetical protein